MSHNLPTRTQSLASLAKGKGKRNKYRVSAKEDRTWNGVVYASKAEMLYAIVLADSVRLGIYDEVVRQPIVCLGPIDYRPDFAIRLCGSRFWRWIDVKGAQTPEFRLKVKLWRDCGPGELHIVKRSGKGFKTVEVVMGGRK